MREGMCHDVAIPNKTYFAACQKSAPLPPQNTSYDVYLTLVDS